MCISIDLPAVEDSAYLCLDHQDSIHSHLKDNAIDVEIMTLLYVQQQSVKCNERPCPADSSAETTNHSNDLLVMVQRSVYYLLIILCKGNLYNATPVITGAACNSHSKVKCN